MKSLLMALFGGAVLYAGGGEWKGLVPENWIAGPQLKATELRRKVTVVAEWGTACPDCAESVPFVQKNVLGQRANGHPCEFLAVHGAAGDAATVKAAAATLGLSASVPVYRTLAYSEAPAHDTLPYFYVVKADGGIAYAGADKNDAVVAFVEAIMNLPVPGQLLDPALPLKKLRGLEKRLVMGRSAEGAALSSVKALLKSKKPNEVEEAQAVIDSLARAKKNLEEDIREDLAADDKGAALRDVRWFVTTWPSEKDRYAEDFKRLAADPEAVKAEKAWFAARNAQKKRRR